MSNVRVEGPADPQLVLVFRDCRNEATAKTKLGCLTEPTFGFAPAEDAETCWGYYVDHYTREKDGYCIHVFATAPGTIKVEYQEPEKLSLNVAAAGRDPRTYCLSLAGVKQCILLIVEHLGCSGSFQLNINNNEYSTERTVIRISPKYTIGVPSAPRAPDVVGALKDNNQLITMLNQCCGSIESTCDSMEPESGAKKA
jgi:hypothetical protein